MSKSVSKKSSRDHVEPGQIVEAEVDLLLHNDLSGIVLIDELESSGHKIQRLWNPEKVVWTFDHRVPANTAVTSEQHKIMRKFAQKYGVKYLLDVNEGGHHLESPLEKGLILPGQLIVGADSHTTQIGVVGAYATGIGSLDSIMVMNFGRLWFRVPDTIKVELKGEMPNMVFAKDIMLHLQNLIGVAGAHQSAIEFKGESINNLCMDERIVLSNMATDVGARAGLFTPDDTIIKYLMEKTKLSRSTILSFLIKSDPDVKYLKTYSIEVDSLSPKIALPKPLNKVVNVDEVEGKRFNQGFIGSCAGGRLNDLRMAAQILDGRKVHKDIRLIVTPLTREIYLKGLAYGYIETIVTAGGTVTNPGCGPCPGIHAGVLSEGETCLSTNQRNFPGRMGAYNSKILLASPATVAVSSINGEVTDPRTYI